MYYCLGVYFLDIVICAPAGGGANPEMQGDKFGFEDE